MTECEDLRRFRQHAEHAEHESVTPFQQEYRQLVDAQCKGTILMRAGQTELGIFRAPAMRSDRERDIDSTIDKNKSKSFLGVRVHFR